MTASPRPDTPLRRCRPNLRIDQDLIVEPYGEEDDEERWPDEFQDRPKPEKEPEWDADAGASAASPAEEQQPESGQQPEQDDAYAAAAADDASGVAEGRQWLRDRIEATVSSPPPVKAGAATPGEA
ncbi:hypothetical protein FNF28_01872 [Cafeteria roenbergensis]|uniref:Uncharacterized protein n=1 Tax=Cafeteria roenbergensis TaxID=33653 RepID=A0A5A8DW82_CAFRO|nr:hypothetical protein FNF28_01872 [Cafeteria roenbergensis]